MRKLILFGGMFMLLANTVATSADAMKPDLPQRMFPTFAGPLPVNCRLPEDTKHERENTGPTVGQDGIHLFRLDLKHEPFGQLLCSSAVLQAHYVRRERRSKHFSMWLDIGTLAAATVGAGLVAFGGSAKAILATGLAGGAIAVGRGYKSPEARQILYQKGEAALQCMDRIVISNDPVYARPLTYLAKTSEAADAKMADDDAQLTELETRLLVVIATRAADPELVSFQEAAKQALVALKSLRAGPTDLSRGYQNIAATIMNRYQNTRAPLDFGRAMEAIKQNIGQAQTKKLDATTAAEGLLDNKDGKDSKDNNLLNENLKNSSTNSEFQTMKDLKPFILQILTSRYDSIRTLQSDISLCETIASI